MLNKFLIALVCCLFSVNLACQATDTTSKNANAVSNSVDSANMPPGFSGSPIPINGNSIPGITNVNQANVNKPAPGIPDSTKAGKTPLPKGTPTPGIPDPETLKKQMNTPIDPSVVNNPKGNNQPEGKPANKPKTVRKP